jgi:PAS domain S-box-containing protein
MPKITRGPWRIKQALILFVLVAVTLPIALAGWWTYHSAGKTIERETYRNTSLMIHVLQLEVNQFHDATTHRLEVIGDILFMRKLIPPSAINTYLATTAKHAPFFESIFILSEQGIVEHLFPYDREMIGIDFSGRDFFQNLMGKGQSGLNHINYSLATGSPTFPLAIRYGGKVIVGHVKLSAMTGVFYLIKSMDAGEVIVTDASGTALFHPDPAFVAEQRNLKVLDPIRKAMTGQSGAILFKDGDEERIGSYALLAPFHWPVLVQQKRAKAFALQRAVGDTVLYGIFITTGFVLIIGLLGAFQFERLFKAINAQIDWLRTGSGAFNPPLKTQFSEIDVILNNFASMARTVCQREEELSEREERYRLLVEHASDGIVTTDSSGRYQAVNSRFSEMVGYTREELLGLHISDLLVPEEASQLPGYLSRLEAEGAAVREWRVRRKDASLFTVEVSARMMPNGHRLAIVRDITNRKRAEAIILEREAQYREIFNNSPTAIWEEDFSQVKERFASLRAAGVTDFPDHLEKNPAEVGHLAALVRIVSVNEASRNLLGFESMDTLVRDLPHYFTDESMSVFKEEMIALEAGHLHFDCEIPIINGRGQRRLLVLSLAVSQGHEESLGRVLVSFSDITATRQAEAERRELEERLQRAEKMQALGHLAGGVAHDLNNVLGVTMVYAELLRENLQEGNPLRKSADSILASTQKATAIIEDLLTLARRGVPISQVIDLNQSVGAVLGSPEFERLKNEHPLVTLKTDIDPDLLRINGSPVHLEKSIYNLLSNAMEAISEWGEVSLKTESRYLDSPVKGYDEVMEGDYAVLTVSDTGGGISPEDIRKIFEPFYTKKSMGRSGTGLGLAIVWGMVKDHQGYIDIRSTVGKGTSFVIYFPVTREEMTPVEGKTSIERYLGNGESILVVDDVAEQRQVATAILTRLGYRVEAVSSGEAAVEHLKSHQAELLILDMIMAPGIDGLETYKLIREIHPRQKAIIVSGFSETERVREAQKLGAGPYIKKPYQMEKIARGIREELDRTDHRMETDRSVENP